MVVEIMVTSVLIPVVGALIYMLKRQSDKDERHDKWMVEQCNKLMKHQDEITKILNNHFQSDRQMQGRLLRSLRIIAKELERIKP